jgi:hypothetical protein
MSNKQLKNKLERLITFIEVEIESPNNGVKCEEDYDNGFTDGFKDILVKLKTVIKG